MKERIRDILLQHRGKENAITAKEISAKMGYPMEDTQSVSWYQIKKTEEKYNLPLVSGREGYYIAQTDEEMEKYNQNIRNRMEKMEQRRLMANENYKEWNK